MKGNITYNSCSKPFSMGLPNTKHFQTRPNQAHLNQLISTLAKTARLEMDGSDKVDVQNVYSWGTEFGKTDLKQCLISYLPVVKLN